MRLAGLKIKAFIVFVMFFLPFVLSCQGTGTVGMVFPEGEGDAFENQEKIDSATTEVESGAVPQISEVSFAPKKSNVRFFKSESFNLVVSFGDYFEGGIHKSNSYSVYVNDMGFDDVLTAKGK